MEDCYIIMKQRRQQLGLSQRALAKICGYTDHTTITKMEQGQVDASIGRLRQIAGALELTIPQLLGFEKYD